MVSHLGFMTKIMNLNIFDQVKLTAKKKIWSNNSLYIVVNVKVSTNLADLNL